MCDFQSTGPWNVVANTWLLFCVTCSSNLQNIWTGLQINSNQTNLPKVFTEIVIPLICAYKSICTAIFVQFTCYSNLLTYWPIYSHHKKVRFPPLKLSHQTIQAIFEVAYSATPRLRRRSLGEISTSIPPWYEAMIFIRICCWWNHERSIGWKPLIINNFHPFVPLHIFCG